VALYAPPLVVEVSRLDGIRPYGTGDVIPVSVFDASVKVDAIFA